MTITEPTSSDPSFDAFFQSLHDTDVPGTPISPQRFCEALQIDPQTLAELAGVHPNTVARAPTSQDIQNFLCAAVRVIKAATDLSGDFNKALFWYRNEPIDVFHHKTAERLVGEKRSDALLRYIASVEAGWSG